MTADVTIEVARVADVLRVPNAALRFQPIAAGRSGGDGARAAAPPAGARDGGGLSGAAAALSEATAVPARRSTVHVAGPGGSLRAVAVRSGLTDGRFTQIVEGDLQEGDRVAVGVATARSGDGGAFPGAAPGPTRGRRPF